MSDIEAAQKLLDAGPPTRKIEFLAINDDNTWDVITHDVPVRLVWEGMQDWADKNIATMACYRKCHHIIPWNENPE